MPKFAFSAYVNNATRWYKNARNDVSFPSSGQLAPDTLAKDWIETTEADAKANTGRCGSSIAGSTQIVADLTAANKLVSDNPTVSFYIIAGGLLNTDKNPAEPAKGYFVANNGVLTLFQYLPA